MSETLAWHRKLCIFFATGFGLGYAPVASGTFGTLPGLLIVWILNTECPSWIGQAIVALVLSVLAIPIADVAEKVFLKKDDGRVVVDEYLTFPVCMIGLPVTPLMLGIAFVTSRMCDIIKPPPARGFQRFTGGFGIVIDDFIANLYCLAINHGIYWGLKHFAWI
jgi:phosphatidylglycerophosphatase A